MSSYPIQYTSTRSAGTLVPSGPGGATGQDGMGQLAGRPVPAGVSSTEGETGMGRIGVNFAPPPLTRYAASGASQGSTAVDRWGEDTVTTS